jgi:lambda repressor-like predicted transcriptional regulator
MAAAWPFPAQRGDDEDTRAQGLSLRDLHPPADLTVTGLARALPYSWAEQEQAIGLLQ